MPNNVIINGDFGTSTNNSAGSPWTGADQETREQGVYLGNGSTDRVAELDGGSRQTSTLQQTFNIDQGTIDGSFDTTLSFDTALRDDPNAGAGDEGFIVTIEDSSGTVIFSETIFPTATSFGTLSFSVDFPAAGDYTLKFTEAGDNDSYGALLDNVALMVCLTAGTMIDTPDGEKAIETLKAGDLVVTKNGPKALRWIGRRVINSTDLAQNDKLRPVRIDAGALGKNLPEADMLVSRQHRMQVSSDIAERMFGVRDVLVSAIRLTELPGIDIDSNADRVEYFHLLFDEHQIIFANGAPTESLYAGPMAMSALSDEARGEILAIFPELEEDEFAVEPACMIPEGRRQRSLVERHLRNAKPIL